MNAAEYYLNKLWEIFRTATGGALVDVTDRAARDLGQVDVVDLEQIAGVVPQMDDTDKLAVSLYATRTIAGDTPIAMTPSGAASLKAALYFASGDAVSRLLSNTDALAASYQAPSLSEMYACNGTSWDRQRNNEEATLLASAARTTETDSADQINYNGGALILVVNVTLDPATADITPTLQLKDPISGAYFTVWTAAAAISAVGTYTYLFQPAAAAGSHTEAISMRIARTWRLRMTVADADSMTYSVAAVTLV